VTRGWQRLRTLVLLAPVATVFAAEPPSTSPPPADPRVELARRIVQLQQPAIEQMASSIVEQMARRLLENAGNVLARMPVERREAVARDVEADVRQFMDGALPLVRSRALTASGPAMAPVLAERLTAEELQDIVRILESPSYRQLQRVAPELQRRLTAALVPDVRPSLEQQIRRTEQRVAQHLGLTAVPPSSAPTPAAPPSATNR